MSSHQLNKHWLSSRSTGQLLRYRFAVAGELVVRFMSTVTLLFGLPCTGKSTTTKLLQGYGFQAIKIDEYVSNLKTNPSKEDFIENGLHWVLDMVFREGESRIRRGGTPAIFNQFRQLANNILRGVDSKPSMKARRFQAAIGDRFRERAIFQSQIN